MHWKYQSLISLPKTRNRTCSNPRLIPDQICHTQFKVSAIVIAEIVTAHDIAKTDAKEYCTRMIKDRVSDKGY